jgi:hypothetical protein
MVNGRPAQAYIYVDENNLARSLDGKIINDKTVIEYYYYTGEETRDESRFRPMKTRHDKTDSVIKYGKKYMNVTIDEILAETILRNTILEISNGNWKPSSPASNMIESVISGTHKTYRYILTTGILAKVTNEHCNPLALQAGSNLNGAFDARSLCHNVVVPIERELLEGRLGESNEPYLNKPARFAELSRGNAVRRGNDALLLNNVINILENLKGKDDALIALYDCIYFILKRSSRNLFEKVTHKTGHLYPAKLLQFSRELISLSFEGESSAILAGITFELWSKASGKNLSILTHKINQSGASSKEVSDIDVYEGSQIVFSAEVKDKQFTAADVQHAVNKIANAGLDKLIFLKGPRGVLVSNSELELVEYWASQGINLNFVNLSEFFNSIITVSDGIDKEQLIDWINTHAYNAKVKDETFNHLAIIVQRL